jgi:hypothetical protein
MGEDLIESLDFFLINLINLQVKLLVEPHKSFLLSTRVSLKLYSTQVETLHLEVCKNITTPLMVLFVFSKPLKNNSLFLRLDRNILIVIKIKG